MRIQQQPAAAAIRKPAAAASAPAPAPHPYLILAQPSHAPAPFVYTPLATMPVVIAEDLIPLCDFPTERDCRMAWYATVHESVLYEGPSAMPVETYTIQDWTLNVRLFFYCGTFTDEDFIAHVCVLMRGEVSSLPGVLRAAACNMRLDEAEALGGARRHGLLEASVHARRARRPPEGP